MKHLLLFLLLVSIPSALLADPLPSWRSGENKQAIIAFVERVSDSTNDAYVPPSERIAVFDNDGTLWAEQPVYFQLLFALDRLAAKAAEDPSILTSEALKAGAAKDIEALAATGEEGLLEVVALAHSGATVKEFQAEVEAWLARERHPRNGRAYSEMVYQPMLELLTYLREKDFKTFIVSGGGIHFMRAFAEEVYGIPPEQVIGSIGESSFQIIGDQPVLMKEAGIAFIDDKEGKPIAIDRVIGRRPIFAGGNSDGDFAMLQWTTGEPSKPAFAMIVHHTDAEREWAYDRDSHIGRLDKGLDEAGKRGWALVDMKRDWRWVFPHELHE